MKPKAPDNPESRSPEVGIPPLPPLWQRWRAKLGPYRKAIVAAAAGVIVTTLFTTTHPEDRENKADAETEVNTQQLTAWLQSHNDAQLKEVAFSNPPETTYAVAQFLVDDGSASALEVLKELCAKPEGALAVAECAENLPRETALPLCGELLHNPDSAVRHGALCTLFFIAAKGNGFRGPWPAGMARPSARQESLHVQWDKERANGSTEDFEQWLYKNAVAGFLCDENRETRLGTASEKALILQVEAELRSQPATQAIVP
ncbi:MAG: hypothetical protein WCP06_02435 [Verrucomicrobiota bacterium]